ncbi:SRPBCC family protein [Mesorhizobium sp. L-8-10]|uniref:SRPBCC family protein n=1 Tax=Mesorhizobium sp. L-8-10 TaxID=2744523 RepID=UPI001926D5A9|nr:SRPBCC family protein [Mesorhizobium sp. L-8-10]
MTKRSVHPATIVLERAYEASPERVFAAWTTPEALLRWGSPGDDWEMSYERFEFREGGGDLCRFGPKGGEVYVNETRYFDIVPNERIVSAGSMSSSDKRLFAGMLTVEFHAAGSGCRMVMTEQGVFLDGYDRPENHEAGWSQMLDQLGDELKRGRAAA